MRCIDRRGRLSRRRFLVALGDQRLHIRRHAGKGRVEFLDASSVIGPARRTAAGNATGDDVGRDEFVEGLERATAGIAQKAQHVGTVALASGDVVRPDCLPAQSIAEACGPWISTDLEGLCLSVGGRGVALCGGRRPEAPRSVEMTQ